MSQASRSETRGPPNERWGARVFEPRRAGEGPPLGNFPRERRGARRAPGRSGSPHRPPDIRVRSSHKPTLPRFLRGHRCRRGCGPKGSCPRGRARGSRRCRRGPPNRSRSRTAGSSGRGSSETGRRRRPRGSADRGGPRAARSHSASVGNRPPSQAQNRAASPQETSTTGKWSRPPLAAPSARGGRAQSPAETHRS
jgi:hypothetical protein